MMKLARGAQERQRERGGVGRHVSVVGKSYHTIMDRTCQVEVKPMHLGEKILYW